jgi:hypothetical protein
MWNINDNAKCNICKQRRATRWYYQTWAWKGMRIDENGEQIRREKCHECADVDATDIFLCAECGDEFEFNDCRESPKKKEV